MVHNCTLYTQAFYYYILFRTNVKRYTREAQEQQNELSALESEQILGEEGMI
jgi:hypothetical protein